MSESSNQPSLNEYVKTYQETQQRDRVGLLSEIMSTIGFGSLGGANATTIAGWFGANITTYSSPLTAKALSILPAGLVKFAGLTATASVATPVGWVIGSTVACAAIGWGVSRWLRSGGMQDERRKALGKSILEKMETMFHELRRAKQNGTPADENFLKQQVENELRELAKIGVITQGRVESYIEKLRAGKISLTAVLNIIKEHGKELVNPSLNPNADADAELTKAASVRAFTAMNKGVTDVDEPNEAFLNTMQNRFGVERSRAIELYRDAPLDPNPKETAQQLEQIFCHEVIGAAFSALKETSVSMNQGTQAYSRFMDISVVLDEEIKKQIGEIDNAGDAVMDAINRL